MTPRMTRERWVKVTNTESECTEFVNLAHVQRIIIFDDSARSENPTCLVFSNGAELDIKDDLRAYAERLDYYSRL